MHININTEEMTAQDADALRAMLAVYHPATDTGRNVDCPVGETVPIRQYHVTPVNESDWTAPEHVATTCDSDPEPAKATPPDTDANGLPWDERIHASSKATNQDGTWRYKRGVDKDLVATVEAELRGPAESEQTDIEEAIAATPEPGPVQQFAAQAQAEAEAAVSAPTPPAPPVPPVPAAPAASTTPTAQVIIPRITNAVATSKLTSDESMALMVQAGATEGISDLLKPDSGPKLAALDMLLTSKGL